MPKLREWKTLYQTDREWLRIKRDGSEPTLEVADEVGTYEDEDGYDQPVFLLHEFEVERKKLVPDPSNPRKIYLVPEGYEPSWPHPLSSYEEWFGDEESLEEVARSTGTTPLELAQAFTSPDPKVRAGSYMAVADHFGLDNFDNYPRKIKEPELNERWS